SRLRVALRWCRPRQPDVQTDSSRRTSGRGARRRGDVRVLEASGKAGGHMREGHTGRGPRLTVMALAAVLAAGGWPSAQAVSFQSSSGDWTGSWDTTIGYGQAWRVSGLDCRLVAIADGGCGYSPNIDDGELNYRKKAAFSEALTGVSEIALNYKEQGGIFLRGSGLYDFEVMNATTDHIQLTHDAKGVDFRPLGGALIGNFQAYSRLPDKKPSESGQFGVNFKLYLPNFSQGTQLGLYFLNYSSRLPVVSAMTGSQACFGNAFGAVNAVAAAAQALAAGLPFAAAVATGAAVGQQRAAALGGNLSAATAQQYATIGANTLLAGGNVTNQASNIATHEYGKTAGLFEEFPQDIRMLGVSFNTQIQKTGTALQGEVTFRHNVPLQLDDVELIYASLTPFESGIARLLGEPVSSPGVCIQGVTPL